LPDWPWRGRVTAALMGVPAHGETSGQRRHTLAFSHYKPPPMRVQCALRKEPPGGGGGLKAIGRRRPIQPYLTSMGNSGLVTALPTRSCTAREKASAVLRQASGAAKPLSNS